MEISIKTKFDLGQTIVAFVGIKNKLIPFTVTRIDFGITKDGIDIWYHGDEGIMAMECNCFLSKEEFIAQL